GYLSALVQLRVQHASAGQSMPGREDVRRTFFGVEGKSKLERLITAPMNLPFNGDGSMQGAIMDPDALKKDARNLVKDNKKAHQADPAIPLLRDNEAAEIVQRRREGELKALVAWIRVAESNEKEAEKAYEDDQFRPSDDIAAELHLDDEDPWV